MQFKMKNVLKLRFLPIRPQNLKKISHLILKFTLELQNQVGFFFLIVWPSQNILNFNRNKVDTQSFYFLANNCHLFWGQKICNKHWVSESRLESFAESKSQMCCSDRFGVHHNKTTVSNFKEKSICDFKVAWLY